MALLAARNYDPATVVTKATSTSIPMTALDTTNLRNTFTAPASGNVLVRIKCVIYSSAANNYLPKILLGVLEGSTIVARHAPTGVGNWYASGMSENVTPVEAVFTVTGLTPSQSYTWDAAYGVDAGNADQNIKYGGPNDSTAATSNAYGAFVFEVWAA